MKYEKEVAKIKYVFNTIKDIIPIEKKKKKKTEKVERYYRIKNLPLKYKKIIKDPKILAQIQFVKKKKWVKKIRHESKESKKFREESIKFKKTLKFNFRYNFYRLKKVKKVKYRYFFARNIKKFFFKKLYKKIFKLYAFKQRSFLYKYFEFNYRKLLRLEIRRFLSWKIFQMSDLFFITKKRLSYLRKQFISRRYKQVR